MVQEGVKFFGTVRNTKCFPFELVNNGLDDKRVSNDRVIAQISGNRTSFSALLYSDMALGKEELRELGLVSQNY